MRRDEGRPACGAIVAVAAARMPRRRRTDAVAFTGVPHCCSSMPQTASIRTSPAPSCCSASTATKARSACREPPARHDRPRRRESASRRSSTDRELRSGSAGRSSRAQLDARRRRCRAKPTNRGMRDRRRVCICRRRRTCCGACSDAEPPPRTRLIVGYRLGTRPARGGAEASALAVERRRSAISIFNTPAERMWEAAIRRLGADPATLRDVAAACTDEGSSRTCDGREVGSRQGLNFRGEQLIAPAAGLNAAARPIAQLQAHGRAADAGTTTKARSASSSIAAGDTGRIVVHLDPPASTTDRELEAVDRRTGRYRERSWILVARRTRVEDEPRFDRHADLAEDTIWRRLQSCFAITLLALGSHGARDLSSSSSATRWLEGTVRPARG